ncbi:hypothetical protein DSAG12_00288 [Promethearchaeum syntrophicum]|uniref:Nucleotide modification associated domain-containing protein n=1 Tax=Promethearchaeum syntrophicum TaxID=2594042 RepID=A0A5B9D645_9ARCH|nr:hypothetical protein [Candidatus Prometheoarchaeum syntrophicum]
MKAYGICVFADRGENGFYNPAFENEDGKIKGYELIPIPEDREIGPRFDQIFGTTGKFLSEYIPRRRWLENHSLAHFDPDFVHKTYGDNNSSQNHQNNVPKMLSQLESGDLLVIFARMQKWENGDFIEGTQRVYIVGWIEIEKIIDYQTTSDDKITPWLKEHKNVNSHFFTHKGSLDSFRSKMDIVAIGNSKVGGQLKHPIEFTGGPVNNENDVFTGFRILPDMQEMIADNHQLVYMIGPYKLHYDLINNLLRNPVNSQFITVQLPPEFQ